MPIENNNPAYPNRRRRKRHVDRDIEAPHARGAKTQTTPEQAFPDHESFNPRDRVVGQREGLYEGSPMRRPGTAPPEVQANDVIANRNPYDSKLAGTQHGLMNYRKERGIQPEQLSGGVSDTGTLGRTSQEKESSLLRDDVQVESPERQTQRLAKEGRLPIPEGLPVPILNDSGAIKSAEVDMGQELSRMVKKLGDMRSSDTGQIKGSPMRRPLSGEDRLPIRDDLALDPEEGSPMRRPGTAPPEVQANDVIANRNPYDSKLAGTQHGLMNYRKERGIQPEQLSGGVSDTGTLGRTSQEKESSLLRDDLALDPEEGSPMRRPLSGEDRLPIRDDLALDPEEGSPMRRPLSGEDRLPIRDDLALDPEEKPLTHRPIIPKQPAAGDETTPATPVNTSINNLPVTQQQPGLPINTALGGQMYDPSQGVGALDQGVVSGALNALNAPLMPTEEELQNRYKTLWDDLDAREKAKQMEIEEIANAQGLLGSGLSTGKLISQVFSPFKREREDTMRDIISGLEREREGVRRGRLSDAMGLQGQLAGQFQGQQGIDINRALATGQLDSQAFRDMLAGQQFQAGEDQRVLDNLFRQYGMESDDYYRDIGMGMQGIGQGAQMANQYMGMLNPYGSSINPYGIAQGYGDLRRQEMRDMDAIAGAAGDIPWGDIGRGFGGMLGSLFGGGGSGSSSPDNAGMVWDDAYGGWIYP